MDVAAAMKEGHLMWASSNSSIMLSIIIAMVWQFSGYVAVIFLAAIKNVPPTSSMPPSWMAPTCPAFMER